MGIFLGDRPVSVYFNGASASLPVQGVFLGGVQVFPTGTAATVPVFTTEGYTRLWAVTTKSSGNVSGSVTTDTGYFAVRWWDETTTVYGNGPVNTSSNGTLTGVGGGTFSRAAEGGARAFWIYPSDDLGNPSGEIVRVDISSNELTQLRGEDLPIVAANAANAYYTYSGAFFISYYYSNSDGKFSSNLLSAEAIDQFLTDLLPFGQNLGGMCELFFDNNPGSNESDPTIGTGKNYIVYT
jgi:hypothetical protein